MTISINFLDVGQGDTTVVVLPDGESAVVVDCYTEAARHFIEQNNITSVPFVFLTHSDYDHCSHIVSLLQNHTNARFFVNIDSFAFIGVNNKRRNALLRRLQKLIEQEGLQTSPALQGESLELQDMKIDILHPTYNALLIGLAKGTTNDTSLLLRLTYSNRRTLLTGDLGKRGWDTVIKGGVDLKCDILKFPHHGAYFSGIEDVVRQIDPIFTSVSVGTTNTYGKGHPRPEVLDILDAQKIHYRCTQATPNCDTGLTANHAVKCAGSMSIQISDSGDISTNFENQAGGCGRVTAKYL